MRSSLLGSRRCGRSTGREATKRRLLLWLSLTNPNPPTQQPSFQAIENVLNGADPNHWGECPIKVVDRTALILDIFAQHAKTREGKLQVTLGEAQGGFGCGVRGRRSGVSGRTRDDACMNDERLCERARRSEAEDAA